MLLAIDLGNTQTSFGIFESGQLKHHWRAETKPSRTEDEYLCLLFPLLQNAGLTPESIGAVALCSVVPSADDALESFSKKYLRRKVFKITHEVKGCRLNVDFPAEVGADRLANANYAAKHLPLPAIVVDMGTATTFDVVTEGAVYEGGVILPGPKVSVEALGSKTAKLSAVALQFPSSVIGKNTATCIQAGVLYGYVDLIDGLLARTEKALGKPATIVLTGGLSPLLHDKLSHTTRLLPDLTLEGIEILFCQNSNLN